MSGLEIHDLRLDKAGRRVLEAASLSIGPGRFTAIVGPNGAGKSTLLRALAGLAPAARCAVWLEGRPLSAWRPEALARARAYVAQASAAPAGLTVLQAIALGRGDAATPTGRRAIAAAAERLGLYDLLDRDAGRLSGGELRRVAIARALASLWPWRAGALLLDEPLAGLDLKHQDAVISLARALAGLGLAVAASLHEIDLALACCDRMIVLRGGRVITEGAPRALDRSLLARAFDVSPSRFAPALAQPA